jgi:hypothetical protein
MVMGKRILISEDEKNRIQGMYGIINEMDWGTVILGGAGILFMIKFIRDFIGVGLFKILLNRGNIEKLISELETVFFERVSYDEEKVKVINTLTNDLRNRVNNGKVNTLWQYFKEMNKTQSDIFYHLINSELNKIKKSNNIDD